MIPRSGYEVVYIAQTVFKAVPFIFANREILSPPGLFETVSYNFYILFGKVDFQFPERCFSLRRRKIVCRKSSLTCTGSQPVV